VFSFRLSLLAAEKATVALELQAICVPDLYLTFFVGVYYYVL